MANGIGWADPVVATLTTAGASLGNLSAGVGNANADLDCHSTGNLPGALTARFSLNVSWGTVTSIAAFTNIADLFLVPLITTGLPDVDLTSGASNLPTNSYVGSFICAKAPSSSVAMLFDGPIVDLQPLLYRPYIKNQSGQTMTSGWSLSVAAARQQST